MKNIVLLLLGLFMLTFVSACDKNTVAEEENQSSESSLSESSSDELSNNLSFEDETSNNETSNNETSNNETSQDETSEDSRSDNSIPTDPETGLPIYVPGSIKLYEYDKDIYPNGKPYRDCWYISTGMFDFGQTQEERQYWINNIERDPERMLLVQYIEYFNISKDVFVAAVERERKFYESFVTDMSIEERELPNADILYTFDDEIINHYYRYE